MTFFPAEMTVSKADSCCAVFHLCQDLCFICGHAIHTPTALYYGLQAINESLVFIFRYHVLIFRHENSKALQLLVLIKGYFFRQDSAVMAIIRHPFSVRCCMYFQLKIVLIFLKKVPCCMAKFSAEIAITGN